MSAAVAAGLAPGQLQKDARLCQAHLSRGSKSFALAGLLLPASCAQDAAALYAFCRVADDLIDDSAEPHLAHTLLAARLNALVAASQKSAAALASLPYAEDRALGRTMRKHALPRAPIDALLEGFLWDAQGRSYSTLEDTLAYGARVAGSVGVCMAWLMGQRAAWVLARAADLGVAMQLTNIARDVGEDAERGRVYLPQDMLAEHGITSQQLVAAPNDAAAPSTAQISLAVPEVVAELLGHADVLYARGRSGISALPWRCRLAIDAAARIYQDIGARILHQKPYRLHHRAVVPLWRKLWLVARAIACPKGRRGASHVQRAEPLPATLFLIEPHL